MIQATIEIREIGEADLPQVTALFEGMKREMSPDRPPVYWLFWRFFRNTSFVALDVDLGLVGALLGFRDQVDPTVAYIHKIGVEAKWRQKGVGKALVTRFAQIARHCGLLRLCLTTFIENSEAEIFYRKVGFSEWKQIQKIGEPRHELSMPLASIPPTGAAIAPTSLRR